MTHVSNDTDHARWLQQRFHALMEARQSYEPAWQDLADHFLPTRYKSRNKNGDMWRTMPLLNDTLVDATGILAMRTLAAGLQGGMTSPARPWFQLSLEDSQLARHAPVKEWLAEVTKRMARLFNGSNFYHAVHTLYGELGTFGTAFMLELADFEHGFRFVPFCAGEYCLDINERHAVDVVFRRFRMSTRQLVQRFGHKNVPAYALKATGKNMGHTVVHAIYPRTDRHPDKATGRHMPFASEYWLEGGSYAAHGQGPLLSQGGFMEFPGFGVRWNVAGNEVYGRSPAMDVLPDCRMLQQMGVTMLKAIHKAVDPPTAVSASLKSVGLDLTPGGVNYVEAAPGQSPQAATPILEVRPDIQAARLAMQDVQQQIQKGLYNDLFRLLLDNKSSNVTAKEVAVKEEEKLILLGPALERLHGELFIPLIERTFQLMLRHDLVPPMPKALQGVEQFMQSGQGGLKVEFVSLLAQAQKMVSTQSVERLVHFVESLRTINPQVADILDTDKAVEEYAEYLGVAPAILHSQEEREALRQGRQEAQAQVEQQKIQGEQVKSLQGIAKIAQDLSQIPLEERTALTALLGQVSQGATPILNTEYKE